MKALRDVLDKVHPLFAKGGILEMAYPMYEALDTFLYTPGEVAHGSTHVRDAIDLKRMMITVVMALVPVTLFGMWNVGYQANQAIEKMEAAGIDHHGDWHYTIHNAIGFTNDSSKSRRQFRSRRDPLPADLHRLHVCRRPHRVGLQCAARSRNQRRIPGHRLAVSA